MDCCKKSSQNQNLNKNKKSISSGILYGLVPHIGCIGFIIFSILGVTAAAAFFKPLLLSRYFFHILILISFVFATISAIFYLKKQGIIRLNRRKSEWEFELVPGGIKRKKGYLLTLYGTTIGINLLLFMLIFPIMANIGDGTSFTAAISSAFFSKESVQAKEGENLLSIKVDIPCPGHAPLITGELKTISGVENVGYRFPNLFDISYEYERTSKENILSLDIFSTYKATVVDEKEGGAAAQAVNALKETASQPFAAGSAGAGGCAGGCGGGCGGGGAGAGCAAGCGGF